MGIGYKWKPYMHICYNSKGRKVSRKKLANHNAHANQKLMVRTPSFTPSHISSAFSFAASIPSSRALSAYFTALAACLPASRPSTCTEEKSTDKIRKNNKYIRILQLVYHSIIDKVLSLCLLLHSLIRDKSSHARHSRSRHSERWDYATKIVQIY